VTFQQATRDDAEAIACVVTQTGEGLVEHILDGLVPGVSGAVILSATFMKGEGIYRTDNVIRSRQGEHLSSLLFSYPSNEHRISTLMESLVPAKRLLGVRPILERSVPDSLYINTFWVEEHPQDSGCADALMAVAESRCRDMGYTKISLFCWNDNAGDLRFYTRQGFTVTEHIRMEKALLERHPDGGSILCKELREEH
jgi:ribosomal protein S18 acetylase RimI-like enzyme